MKEFNFVQKRLAAGIFRAANENIKKTAAGQKIITDEEFMAEFIYGLINSDSEEEVERYLVYMGVGIAKEAGKKFLEEIIQSWKEAKQAEDY